MTQVTASEIFAFLEGQEGATIIRQEIAQPAFRSLRLSVRQIVVGLGEAQDQESIDISDQLQALISEWLTVPLVFDHFTLDALTGLLGRPASVQARWGTDMRSWYETALNATETLASITNPIREMIRGTIQRLQAESASFRIYCHRRARTHFESLFISPVDFAALQKLFLHSVRDYRDTKPFDTLIKVGPLRSRGWSSAPDALLSAPRFHTLIQFVWSGCSDEPDFGYDPASSFTGSPASDDSGSAAISNRRVCGVKWTTIVSRSGEGMDLGLQTVVNPEEPWVFKEGRRQLDVRTATLVQVDDEHGILFPAHCQVLSFDPDPSSRKPIARRVPGEDLREGMFVVVPVVGEVDLGSMHAEHGSCSQIWRKSLEEQWQADSANLVDRLHVAGLALVHLKSAVRNWCRPPSTVIHAPQRLSHFRILMRVLGHDRSLEESKIPMPQPFWQLAWNEIRRSRGDAIQAGVLEQEIVDDELFVILGDLLHEIRDQCAGNTGFRLTIPSRHGIHGHFVFFRAAGIEEGFTAPDVELKVVRELRTIDQWRD